MKSGRKGIIYTLFAIVLISLLMFSIALKTKPITRETTINERARVEQLHYYVEDVMADMERATTISFKRALVAIITQEVSTGNFVSNVTEIIPEVTVNGTLNGTELPFLQNETLSAWQEKISTLLSRYHFVLNSSSSNFVIALSNYTEVKLNMNYSLNIRDNILQANLTKHSNMSTSISMEGVEDPFITINTLAYVLNTFRMCPAIESSSYSTSDFYGKAYVDMSSTDFSHVGGKASKVLVTDTLVGKSNYSGFAGVIVENNEIPAESVDYASGVSNAVSLIRNASYVIKHDSLIYLTNLTDEDCTSNGNSSCYFPMDGAPTLLDRLEGRNYHTAIYDPAGIFGIGSYICNYRLPAELRKSSNPLVLDYKYLPLL